MYSETVRLMELAAERADAHRRKADVKRPPSKLRQWFETAVLDPEVGKRMTGPMEEVLIIGPDDEEKADISCYAGGVQLVYLFRRLEGNGPGPRPYRLVGIVKRFRHPGRAARELQQEFAERFARAFLKRTEQAQAI